MRLVSAVLAVALTPAFVALPTVSFAAPHAPHPVAPQVQTTAVGGVDKGPSSRLWGSRVVRGDEELSGEGVLPGFRVPVSDLFPPVSTSADQDEEEVVL